jgi:hypothetical protein
MMKVTDCGRAAAVVVWLGLVVAVGAQEYEFTTLAGNGDEGFANGRGRRARFAQPQGVALDNSGRLFVADTGNNVIRLVLQDGAVSTFAGSPTNAGGFADGPVGVARFDAPIGLCFDALTNLYVADSGNHVIRKVSPDGVVSTIAGVPRMSGYADGRSDVARFSGPCGVALFEGTNVIVADTGNHLLRKVIAGGVVSTLAGKVGKKGYVDGAITDSRLTYPERVAVGVSNIIYFVEPGYCGIRMLTADGMVAAFVGSTNLSCIGMTDGVGKSAKYGNVLDVAVTDEGQLVIAEGVYGSIRRISMEGTVKTLAGKYLSKNKREVMFGRESRDGVGLNVIFTGPSGIAVDHVGNIYVADTGDDTIRVGRPTAVRAEK